MTRDAEVLRQADAACHDALGAVWGRLDEEIWEPLRSAAEDARAAHREAVASAALLGDCPQDDGVAQERAEAYLVATAETVLQPLWLAVAGCLPADRIGAAVDDARARSVEACSRLALDAEVDGGIGGSMPHDGVARRVGRRLARALGRTSSSRPRKVDVRAAALRHRAERLAGLEEAWRVESSRLWSVWLGRLETCLTAWAVPAFSALTADGADADGAMAQRWDAVVAAASSLEEGLAAIADVRPHQELADAAPGELSRCRGLLESDLSVAGTFLLRPGRPREQTSPGTRAAEWKAWQAQSVMRLQMHASLLAVFTGAHRARLDMVERLRGEILVSWTERVGVGGDALEAVADALASARPNSQPGFDAARRDAEEVLSGLQEACPTPGQLQTVARRVAGMAVGAVQSSLRTVPGTLVLHPLPPSGRPLRRPSGVTRSVALQEMARQAFDALRMERIRTAPAPLVAAAEGLTTALTEIADIVAFGFDAAAAELAGEDEQRCERALELAVEGLGRAADSLRHTSVPLQEALDALDTKLAAEVVGGVGALAGRALAHRMQGRLLDARSRLSGALDGVRRWAGPGLERWTRLVRPVWLRLRRAPSQVLGWMRGLVGAGGAGPTSAARTAQSLATVEELVDALPLVYQHLFAAEPLTDPGLMVGREREVAEVEGRWRWWQEHDGAPLLVTGARGSGMSSFFNVFVSRIADAGARTVHRVLDHRVTTEGELAREVSGVLGMDALESLDELAAAVLGAPAGSLPDLVALEGMEHLYLRVPGGTDLLERFFTFMAETEPKMFWVGSITPPAWQVVEKSEPAVAAQLDRLALGELSADELQAAVLARHRRSGLRLTYEEPVEGRRLLRRRLRRLRGTERHRQVLERDYFERLHKSAQGNLRLALFQWLRSVDFSGGDDKLVVHPLAELDFSFLDTLNLTQNFTLKAFLEHHTLTLAEHDAIFRLPRQESYHVLESLGNRNVVEAVPRTDDAPAVSEVRDDIRYRVRPLLSGAVKAHLASKNIVH